MTEFINAEAVEYRKWRLALRFREHCELTIILLRNNPHGLELPTIQKVVGMSAKTAKRVLAGVADEKDGKCYPKSKGARR